MIWEDVQDVHNQNGVLAEIQDRLTQIAGAKMTDRENTWGRSSSSQLTAQEETDRSY